MRPRWHLLTLLLVPVACSSSEDRAEAAQAALAAEHDRAVADTLVMAEAQFEAAAFDSVTWADTGEAVARGEVVFSYSCRKCHGQVGDGTGGFVAQGDTLRPPTLLAEDWRFRLDHEGLRRQIFVGTSNGMPHWGLEGLKPRDIDAVANYIRLSLRSATEEP